MARPPRLPKIDDLVTKSRIGRTPRPIPVEKHSIRPLGPRIYKLGSPVPREGYGPGEPPPGFLNQWNSQDEWMVYWAICKIKHSPRDCRQPPFVGGEDWSYQNPDPIFGGRIAGGQVFDFIVQMAGKKIALRIQTERFHIFAPAAKQAQDFYLKTHSSGVDDIYDLYSQNYLGKDPQGLIVAVARALKGIREVDPIRAGTSRRVRI